MKKNLRSCMEQQDFGEPECLLDMNDYEMITASGLTPDLRHKKTAHMSAAWSFAQTTRVRIPLAVSDLSGYRWLTFSVFAVSGQGGSFQLRFESDAEDGGEAGYVCTLPVCRNGWNDYRVELPFLRAYKNAAGWDRLRALVLDCAAGGQANRTETVLCLDSLFVWEESAPQIYVRMPELKGAAAFTRTGAYAIVNRRRVPIAPDADPEARPFEAGGLLWLPMAPVAAAIAHKAVVDNKAYTLSFTYRRRKFVFYGNSDRYLVDGEEQTLPFHVAVRAGTLFFPANYLREFFHWRQLYTDPIGVVVLSNRKNVFESGRDDPILWQLNAEMTFVQPTGEEILEDLHRKISNPNKGRLLLSPEEWMQLRRAAKAENEPKELLRGLKEQYGSSSEAFRAAPVFADGAGEGQSLGDGIALAAGRICGFAALYRLTGDKQYAERTAAEQEALASLSDWDAEHNMLHAATAGLAMALGYDWCHHVWSEARKAVLERAMLRYVMRPGVNAYNGRGRMWRSGGAEAAQINCGLTAAALALADVYPETALRILRHSLRSAQACMESYSPDGGYAEGMEAWEKGTRALVLLIAMLQSACGKDYGLPASPGFSATVLFAVSAETANGAWNYHSYPALPVDTAIFGWFSRQFGNPVPAWLRRQEVLSGRKTPDVLDLVFYSPVSPELTPELPLDSVYRKAGLAMLRSGWGQEDTFLGLHGGSNHEVGGELDAGSFLLEMGGERFFAETGGDERLPLMLRRRAEGQNTLVVAPTEMPLPDQNPDAVAQILEARSAPERAYAVLDMSTTNDAILRGKRGILLTADRTIAVVQDELVLDAPAEVVWSAYTRAAVQYAGARTLLLAQNGKTLLCKLCGAGNAHFELTPVEDTGWLHVTVRAAVQERLRMAVACRLYREGTDSRSDRIYECRPMSGWAL